MSLIVSRTPFRISFFGGGTDYPAWYRQEGGAVLSTSIDKYCYITCRYLPPFFPGAHRVVWTHIEVVSRISEILHPAVREGMNMLEFDDSRGVEIHHQGDLPARTGMGSSSAFAVGLINALEALRDRQVSQTELYLRAIELEQERLRENVGSQDQVAAAVGGLNRIRFEPSGEIVVEPVPIRAERRRMLEDSLVLFYTGGSRTASEVAGKVIRSLGERATELHRMRRLVDEAHDILTGSGDLDEFGHLLDETWRLKRSLDASVSTEQIDEIYEVARRNGALGGKLLGAGGTGFMLFYVPVDQQPALLQAMKSQLRNLMHVPFRFDDAGSTLLQMNPLTA